MKVILRTDGSISHRGFRARWSTDEPLRNLFLCLLVWMAFSSLHGFFLFSLRRSNIKRFWRYQSSNDRLQLLSQHAMLVDIDQPSQCQLDGSAQGRSYPNGELPTNRSLCLRLYKGYCW